MLNGLTRADPPVGRQLSTASVTSPTCCARPWRPDLDEPSARSLLDLLMRQGVIHDAGRPRPLRCSPWRSVDRLKPDLDALDLASATPTAAGRRCSAGDRRRCGSTAPAGWAPRSSPCSPPPGSARSASRSRTDPPGGCHARRPELDGGRHQPPGRRGRGRQQSDQPNPTRAHPQPHPEFPERAPYRQHHQPSKPHQRRQTWPPALTGSSATAPSRIRGRADLAARRSAAQRCGALGSDRGRESRWALPGRQTQRPDLVILAPVRPLDGLLVNELLDLGIPHLLVSAFEGFGSRRPAGAAWSEHMSALPRLGSTRPRPRLADRHRTPGRLPSWRDRLRYGRCRRWWRQRRPAMHLLSRGQGRRL